MWTVLALYAAFVSIVSAFHEPWKDETQAWRLAIDSHGLRELAHNARYEGHPLLFHVMMQALGHLSRSWWAVATLHVIIASFAAWLVLRYAPFTRLQKVLLVFGYWMAYEYAVVVRPYGLGMMLAFAACIAWTARPRRTGMGGALSRPAGQHHADGHAARHDARARLRGGLGVARRGTAAALAASRADRWRIRRARSRRSWCSSSAAVQMKPPADAAYKGEPRVSVSALSKWDLGAAPDRSSSGRSCPWCTRRATACSGIAGCCCRSREARSRALLLASLAALALGAILASRRRMALLLFVVGTAGYLLFFGLFFPGAAHHHGYLFVVWILERVAGVGRSAQPVAAASLQRLSERFEPERSRILTLSLVLPVVATVELAGGDLVRPFADARHVADIIRSRRTRERDDRRHRARPRGRRSRRSSTGPCSIRSSGSERTFVVWGGASPYRRDGAGDRQRRDAAR